MPGLNTSLNIAVQALEANQGALNVTSNNIANVNTPGYSRQVAILNEAPTFQENNITFGGGVTLEQFQSVRDQLLQLRIYEETQQQGSSETQFNSSEPGRGNFFRSEPGRGRGAVGVLQQFEPALHQPDRRQRPPGRADLGQQSCQFVSPGSVGAEHHRDGTGPVGAPDRRSDQPTDQPDCNAQRPGRPDTGPGKRPGHGAGPAR